MSAYRIHPATPEDISWIARLETEVYSAGDAIPEHILIDWYNSNPNGFSVIRKGEERIGHVDILPLRLPTLQRFLSGLMVERDIRGGDLFTPDESGSIRDLYVESVAVLPRPGSSSAPVVSSLLRNFISLVGRLREPTGVENVYAIAASEAGERLLSHLGFVPVQGAAERADKHELWGAELSNISGNLSKLFKQ